MKREVVDTADGSKTIYISEMDEHYHSNHGALQEAIHVFIQHGLKHFEDKQHVRIFEMGFGTGLNALLTAQDVEHTKQTIEYSGIEAYPVELQMAIEIGYDALIGSNFKETYLSLHESPWDQWVSITPNFKLKKIHNKIEEYQPESEMIDLVYYDAFGPRAQESMWAPSILQKMYDMLAPNGILVTYCAKGQVKRDLRALGFTVETLPGPPGKREMTRAYKQ